MTVGNGPTLARPAEANTASSAGRSSPSSSATSSSGPVGADVGALAASAAAPGVVGLAVSGVGVPREDHGDSGAVQPGAGDVFLRCQGSDIESLFIDRHLPPGCMDAVTTCMSYHPTYLDIYRRTQNFILRGDGPLPFDYRYYIAIMASGRHQCSFLIDMQEQEFLQQGGDPEWLRGLRFIPKKLHDLYEINKILAHRPWLLSKAHIKKLTKGQDSWSLAEVVHAIVLLTHFHSLASFVYASGISNGYRTYSCTGCDQEPYVPLSSSPLKSQLPSNAKQEEKKDDNQVAMTPPEPEVDVDTLMERMKTLSEKSEEVSAEEQAKRFEHVESQSAELSFGQPTPVIKLNLCHLVEDPEFGYVDFAPRSGPSRIPTFRVQDYSWDDHGYSLINRLYSEVGNLLDDKFKTTASLTYNTMGGRQDVDTTRFRRAIWNYIQCMYGIRHDDYDYGEVNQLLERSLKAFIKSACCFPERLTRLDYQMVMREFLHSEKIHVNLMILEARMQAELMYALRAMMRYMT